MVHCSRYASYWVDGALWHRISSPGVGRDFFWFGVLKFFPDLSPAQELATQTISILSLGLMPAQVSLPVLAAWECVIGLGLMTGRWLRATLLLLFLQMVGTLLPVVFFPGEVFRVFPYAPTLEGQYIFKNFVLIGAGLVIGATVRGGHLSADPTQVDGHTRRTVSECSSLSAKARRNSFTSARRF